MNQENYRQLISAYVIRRYKISDPRVLALEEESVADILKGRIFRNPKN